MTASLSIGGAERACDTDGVDITIGRRGVKEQGAAGYARTYVTTTSHAGIIAANAPLTVTADDGSRRFAGRVTDSEIEHPEPGQAGQPVTAVGPLADWGTASIGDEPWPAETVAERAQRIAALIGQPVIVQGGAEQVVISKDVDRRPARELLTQLADSTGGWVFDHNGAVYLQALDARRVTVETVTWADEPAADTWDDLDATAWAGDDAPSPLAPIVLECGEVQAEPVWAQTSEVTTAVEVVYGEPDDEDNRASVIVTDDAAIAVHGTWLLKLDSQLLHETDAITLGGLILTRAATPQWGLDTVTVPWEWLRPETAARLAGAIPGVRVTVNGLPQPAPAAAFPGVIEGWREEITGDARRVTLWLSHVAHSLAVPTWDAEPAGETWDMLDPDLTWENDL